MNPPRRRFLHLLAGAAALSAASGGARAQTWPTRPVRVIVPFQPGGGSDTQARLLAKKFYESMGQTFVIDNRAGAGGLIGASEAEAARVEIARRLLAASDRERDLPAPTDARSRRVAAIVALLGIPLAAIALYLPLGSPQLGDFPLVARARGEVRAR